MRTSVVVALKGDQAETLNNIYTLVGEGKGTFIPPATDLLVELQIKERDVPTEFFPAIFVDTETKEEFFCRSAADIPEGRYISIKEHGLTPMLCKCELTGRWRVVYKSARCEQCPTHAEMPLKKETVEKMLEDINDYITTLETLIDKWRPRTA